jgi:hypothetical protein
MKHPVTLLLVATTLAVVTFACDQRPIKLRTADPSPAADPNADLRALVELNQRANTGDHQAVERVIGLIFGEHTLEARRIAWRESRFMPWAKNPRSSASGLMQLLDIHAWRFGATGSSWAAGRFDALANVKAARHLFDEQGWQPWRCC